MHDLGLFPLHIVLFPGASYPLHIFEERYKELVSESLRDRQPFGINLVDGGKMFDIGCRVLVTRILKEYPDGRRDVVVTGSSRYRVRAVRPTERLYITASVEDFEDQVEKRDVSEMERTISLYNELVDRVYGVAEEKLDPADWITAEPSFRIAQKSGLDLLIRQQLLETTSENERLTFLTGHLEEILPKIRQINQIRMLSRNDGYLPRG